MILINNYKCFWLRFNYVWNLLKIGKYENTASACTNYVLGSLSITECKIITSSSLLLPLTKLVISCTSTIINSLPSSKIVWTKLGALFIPIISVIVFHISLSYLKSSLSSLWIETNVILFLNLCISPKKFFIFACNGAKINLCASIYLIKYSWSLLYSIILLTMIL